MKKGNLLFESKKIFMRNPTNLFSEVFLILYRWTNKKCKINKKLMLENINCEIWEEIGLLIIFILGMKTKNPLIERKLCSKLEWDKLSKKLNKIFSHNESVKFVIIDIK